MTHERNIECTSCGGVLSNTKFFRASKQLKDIRKPIRVNQPCKDCCSAKYKEKRHINQDKFYNSNTSRHYYRY